MTCLEMSLTSTVQQGTRRCTGQTYEQRRHYRGRTVLVENKSSQRLDPRTNRKMHCETQVEKISNTIGIPIQIEKE